MKRAIAALALYLVSATPVVAADSTASITASQAAKQRTRIYAALPTHNRQVIKYGKHFLLFDENGMARDRNLFGYGLYRDDTRYLNEWNIRLNGTPLTILSGNTDDGYGARYVYCNNTQANQPGQIAQLERDVLIDDCMREHYRITNFDVQPRTFTLDFDFSADFADIFEVRGQPRAARGEYLPPELSAAGAEVTLPYKGLDHEIMRTTVGFNKPPGHLTAGTASYRVVLMPHQSWEVDCAVVTSLNEDKPILFKPGYAFADEKAAADRRYKAWRDQGATIDTDNLQFNRWFEKGWRDLYILQQPTPKGECIAAGVPWYAAAFGRDEEITSIETLPYMPQLSKMVLNVLSAYQGAKDNKFQEEHPGRIMHELRLGEMARLKEIPFVPYYGTVDASPLFVVLMGLYLRTTDDITFVKAHWGNVKAALGYLETLTQDGYLRYGFDKNAALSNQGWKDSSDSVMYGDGQLAKPPIALCEAQGYLYSAYLSASNIAARLGNQEAAKKYGQRADELKARFQKDFWDAKLNFFALALDGQNKQCDVVSSNPGHLLSTGIISGEHEQVLADRLMNAELYSGWGIRTLSDREKRYNPFSYHDGTVWPHDNGMIAVGLGAVGRTDLAAKILSSMFCVAQSTSDLRLPELFCGYPDDFAHGPLWYPVSCSPQAWAAGSPFLMLQGALGLSIDAEKHTVHVRKPQLPDGVNSLTVHNLSIGDGKADLKFHRDNGRTVCEVSASSGVYIEYEPAP